MFGKVFKCLVPPTQTQLAFKERILQVLGCLSGNQGHLRIVVWELYCSCLKGTFPWQSNNCNFVADSFLSFVLFLSDCFLRTNQFLSYPILYSIAPVEIIAQDGMASLDSSQTGGEKPLSNKVQHVYTRRKLQQKKVQPIIPTLEQIDFLISSEIVPGNTEPPYSNSNSNTPIAFRKGVSVCTRKSARTCSRNHPIS